MIKGIYLIILMLMFAVQLIIHIIADWLRVPCSCYVCILINLVAYIIHTWYAAACYQCNSTVVILFLLSSATKKFVV